MSIDIVKIWPKGGYVPLSSKHCNASWRGQFMYIAQLAPHNI